MVRWNLENCRGWFGTVTLPKEPPETKLIYANLVAGDYGPVLEFYCEDRKVTMYMDSPFNYVKCWGDQTSMNMDDGKVQTQSEFEELVRWLGARTTPPTRTEHQT